MVTAEQRRTAVREAITTAAISERQACRYTGFARASQRYRTRCPARTLLWERLATLAGLRPRWGYRRLAVLLRREGHRVNRKLVYRLYRVVSRSSRLTTECAGITVVIGSMVVNGEEKDLRTALSQYAGQSPADFLSSVTKRERANTTLTA